MIDPITAGVIGTLITATASIIVAFLQSRSKETQPLDKSGILVPEGAKLIHPARSRKTVIWIFSLALLGGCVGYSFGAMTRSTSGASPISTSVATATLSSAIINTPSPQANTAVVATPTTDAQISTPTLPTRTDTHTSSVTVTSSPVISPTPRPTTLITAIAPVTSPDTGTLDVQVSLEGCENLIYAIQGGTGNVNIKKQVAVGTYTIALRSHFGNGPTQEGIVVQKGQTTTVDLTQQLGQLRVDGYPQIGAPEYAVSAPGTIFQGWLGAGSDKCGPVGTYKVTFQQGYSGGGIFDQVFWTALLPDNVRLESDVEVKAGATTVVGPDSWPYQLGRLAFLPAKTVVGQAQIENAQTGVEFYGNLNNSGGQYWMIAGTYKITLSTQPYTGTTYEFEIKPGEETILQLPTSP